MDSEVGCVICRLWIEDSFGSDRSSYCHSPFSITYKIDRLLAAQQTYRCFSGGYALGAAAAYLFALTCGGPATVP